ncbi:PHP domain-containing protein [Silvibacterium acidisoli]|uniref:PHP domain-containing protein n=1 Tax=Acidobacteriaceae bacterium ZG23-2 TaxID=2883246 RepID=UPI00406CDC26
MAGLRRISYMWKDADAAREYATGVSLHSHTNQSKETLDFLATFGKDYKLVRKLIQTAETRARRNHSVSINYSASYWTPPLTPRLAFDLESRQIEKAGLAPLVSITDHDNINAPMLLRTVAAARHIPVSVEWSVPYGGDQAFHLGIHNLPSESGAEWMKTFEEFTASPSEPRLTELLAALHAMPNVLIVFNHPLWDLYIIGKERHRMLVNEFMETNGRYIHALELNGLRSWEENREVKQMAKGLDMLLISGGDRHGMEPNANINLTSAKSFTEFVHEVRYENRSHVLFMPQYAEPWKHRILQSTLDAIRDYPDFPQGSRTWDERVFHPDSTGAVRSLSELWPGDGRAPWYLRWAIDAVRMMGSKPVSGSLRMAWGESRELNFMLGEELL